MTEFLTNLLNSLEQIEVKGKNNLDLMLGCMMAIENVIGELNKGTEENNG